MLGMDGFQTLIFISLATLIVLTAVYFCRLYYEVEGIRVYKKERKRDWFNIALVLVAAFLVKSIFSVMFEGYETDMTCFYRWSEMIFEDGIGEFYYLDAFTDYPPGYMAILWVIAGIRQIFSIETMSTVGRFLIKLVPVLSDLGAGFLLYTIAKKKFSEGSSLLLAAIYVLNPVVILDSSVWGQTDGVFTLFVLLTCYLCMEEKRIPAYFAFIVGVLIKPQTLIFAPILIWTIIEQVFMKGFDIRKAVKDLVGGLAAIATMFVLALPFGLEKVISQYVDTLGSYEYCTINAYNLWALLGKNWADQTGKFLFLEYRQWGMVAIFAAVILSAFIFFKLKEDKSRYFLSTSVVVSTMFLFSVRMHERYLFPVIVLTLCAFLVKPTKELFFTYVGFSFVQFLNVGHVLYYFQEYESNSTAPQGGILGITALLTIAVYGYMFFASFSKTELEDLKEAEVTRKKKRNQRAYIERHIPKKEKKTVEKKKFSIMSSKVMKKFTKWDWIALCSIMAVYSAFALYDLGRMSAPETQWSSESVGSTIELDLGEAKRVKMLHTYLGNYEERKFTLDFSQNGKDYETVGEVHAESVFAWNEMKQEDNDSDTYNLAKDYRYIRLTSNDDRAVLRELVILDKDGTAIVPANKEEYSELFDEQTEFDPLPTFRSGTYFDEIYHARTAYEMTQPGTYCYENTHPPFGKILISLGIRAFGMNPFGWRIVGVLFGILMLPLMYMFGRRLFDCRTWAAGALTFLFAFDFMHFTQTRISTIDVYGTFFIIAMFYFMLQYSQMSFYDTPLRKTFVPLGLSAVMMGLGCAAKWTAVYAAVGLAVFFFTVMGVRYYEYKLACKNPSGSTSGISHQYIQDSFKKKLCLTLIFCVIFFIIVAGLIYLCSYIPFNNGTDNNLWQRMIQNQKDMYDYHSGMKTPHSYSSSWYEWPTMIRPMFYYCQTLANGLKEGISAFGNPLVWWAGIPAFLYMLYLIYKERDRGAIFMVFAYLVQIVPWTLVSRCTFSYHYFPSVPFVAMMIVYIMVRLVTKDKKWMRWIIAYCAAAFVLFLLFYPVLSGEPVPEAFVRDGLCWLPDWTLIY